MMLNVKTIFDVVEEGRCFYFANIVYVKGTFKRSFVCSFVRRDEMEQTMPCSRFVTEKDGELLCLLALALKRFLKKTNFAFKLVANSFQITDRYSKMFVHCLFSGVYFYMK